MKQKPYHILLWTGLLFVIMSCFLNQNNTVDIHLHDTYFVIAHASLFWLLAFLAVIIWLLYVLTRNIMYSKALTRIHLIVTVFTLLLSAYTICFGDAVTNRYYDFSNWESFNFFNTYIRNMSIIIGISLFGQLLFPVNFILGLSRRRS